MMEDVTRIKEGLNIRAHRRTTELIASKQQLEKIFEAASEGLMQVSVTGKIIKANLAAAEIFKIEPAELEKRELLLPEWKISPEVEILRSDGTPMMPEEMAIGRAIRERRVIRNVETGIRTPGSPVTWLNISAAPLIDAVGAVESIVFSFMDITERKHAEQALSEANKFNSTLLDNSPIPIIVYNKDTSIRYINKAFEKATGYTSQEIIGLVAPYPWWPGDQHQRYLKTLKKDMFEKVSKRQRMFYKKTGEEIWIEITHYPVEMDGEVKFSIANWVDITEEKKLREELQLYSRRIIKVQEEERKRVARELHDDTAQSLAILALEIESIIRSKDICSETTRQKLIKLREGTNRAMRDVRRYSYELRPGVLDYLGLIAALEQLTEEENRRGLFKVALEISGSERKLPNDIELSLFRIVQEALNSIRNLARATIANIHIEYLSSKVRITISGNGRGLDLTESKKSMKKSSLGLLGMRERAYLIGADFKIETKADKETIIRVELAH